jgi:ribosomal protein S18 acetylase RimI-like enzyme
MEEHMAKPKEHGAPTTITLIESARLDELHELWQALHRYHGEIGSSPLVADEDAAWERRRALYRTWLEAGEALVLLAERNAAPVGYAVVHLQDGPDDTFPLGARWAEIYSLSVAPAARGQGIGSLLLDAIDSHLTALGIHDLSVSAMVENEAALRLYESRGFVRREVVLYRFGTTAQP